MPVAVRSSVAAGAVLVAVGTMSVNPVAASESTVRLSTLGYSLTASSSLLNVSVNMLNLALSVPGWEVQAMNRFADAMIGTGSWQVWGPTNVFGFDEWDPPKLAGVIETAIPVQPFSSVLADQVNWWAKANAPMNAGCAAVPGACPDFWASAKGYLKVPVPQLYSGYQFPTVTNPFTLQPTSWSGQYVKLQPGAAFTSLWNYLSGEPQGVATVPISDYVTVPLKLGKSILDAYYPFVQNSEWFNPKTPFSWAFRALAPLTCPTCGPEPYDNPWLYENYPPKPAAIRTTPAPAAATTAGVDTVAPSAPDTVTPASVPAVPVDAPGTPKALQLDSPVPDPTPAPAIDTPAAIAQTPTSDAPPSLPAPSATESGPVGHRGPAAGNQSPASRNQEKASGRSSHSDAGRGPA